MKFISVLETQKFAVKINDKRLDSIEIYKHVSRRGKASHSNIKKNVN